MTPYVASASAADREHWYSIFSLSCYGAAFAIVVWTSAPNESAYPLYALSNLGSLLALLAYPWIIEPNLTLLHQGWIWSAAYLVVTLLCGTCGFLLISNETVDRTASNTTAPSMSTATIFTRFLWIALAACGSAMLLAITNMICQEVAVIPLLWVLPLAIYLVSFIACFARRTIYRRWLFHPLFGMAVILALAVSRQPTSWDIPAYLLLLFVICMTCHGELVRLKPPSTQLTSFYLGKASPPVAHSAVSSSALVAPQVFNVLWELPIAEAAAAVTIIAVLLRDRDSWFYDRSVWLPVVLVWGVVLYFRALAVMFDVAVPWSTNYSVMFLAFALIAVWLVRRRGKVKLRGWLRPVQVFTFALIGMLTYYTLVQMKSLQRGALYASRNFFGTLTVLHDDKTISLKHGRTLHRLQILDPKFKDTPTSYYLADSGIGSLLLEERRGHFLVIARGRGWLGHRHHRCLRASGRLLPLLRNQP